MSVSIAGGQAQAENFEDEMEEALPFEIPDYLKAVMNQHEQVVFARNMNMNYRNESDLEDMTPDDFENLGIHSAKTRRFMRRAILAHFDPGFTERVRVWQNEINAPQTGAVDAVVVDAVLVEDMDEGGDKEMEELHRSRSEAC